MPSLTARWMVAFLLAASLAAGAVRAEGRELTERREHVDARHQHNRRYLDRGVVLAEAPRDAWRVHVGGSRYRYDGGVWYQADGSRFVVSDAPLGAVVEVLPPYFTTLRAGGVQYYYANDTYYVFSARDRGFDVIAPPVGIEATDPAVPGAGAAPPAETSVYIDPKSGQSPEQQATDRYECHRWAAQQTGFDPTRPGAVAPAGLAAKRADYGRAERACLEGRGYTVR